MRDAERSGSAQAIDVVVVLNYHGRDDTLRCIASLNEGPDGPVVVLVDNASGDGVIDEARRRWPDLRYLQLTHNSGFTGGMNAGLRLGLSLAPRSLTILNNDTELPPGAISHLAAAAGENSAVSPEIRYLDAPERVWFAGGFVDLATNLPQHLDATGIERHRDDAEGLPWETELLAGCCITASAATWQRVGLLDDRFFLNFEDSDWSARARNLGVRLLIDPRVVILHRVSASFTGAYSYLGLYYYTRNGLLYGRLRGRGGRMAAYRFWRRHVLPAVTGAIRAREPVDASRRARMVALAMVDNSRRRYGRAGLAQTLAERWVSRD